MADNQDGLPPGVHLFPVPPRAGFFTRYKMAWRTADFALVGAAVLAALPFGGDPMLLIAALAFGLLFAHLGIWTSESLNRGGKTAWAIGATLAIFAEGALLYWHAHPHINPPAIKTAPRSPVVVSAATPVTVAAKKPHRAKPSVGEVLPKTNPLLVQCNQGFMPTLALSPTQVVHLMQLIPSAESPSPIGNIFLLKGGNFNMDGKDGVPAEAVTCTITNYGTATIINATIKAKIHWWNTSKDGNTTHMTNPAFDSDAIIGMEKIDSGVSAPFTFFIINHSDKVADVTFPDAGKGNDLNTNLEVQLPIRATPNMLRIFPAAF